MSTLEQDLAELFRTAADEAPNDLGLLSRVQASSARRTRRHRIGVSLGAGALTAAAAVVVVTVLPQGRDTSLRYSHDPRSFFTDNTVDPTFPFTPGTLPQPLEAPMLLVTPHESVLTWSPMANGVPGNLQVAVSTSRPAVDPQRLSGNPLPTRHTVQVRGTTGTLSCDTIPQCRLTWQEPSGAWLRVDHAGDRAATVGSETLGVAEGLRARPYRPAMALRVGRVPRGCRIAELAPDRLVLAGPADCHVTVALVPRLGYPGTPTTYGGRAAVEGPADQQGQRQVFVSYPEHDQAVSLLVPTSWERALIDALVRSLQVR